MTEKCIYASSCKRYNTPKCNKYCYPWVLMYGASGEHGYFGSTGIPTKYKGCTLNNLPTKNENPKAYQTTEKYVSDLGKFVEEKGVGLFLYSIPNHDNPLGTGTGKTTTAITILNEYLMFAVRKHVKKEEELTESPCLFVKASEFQNIYNAQFRGTVEKQQQASNKFYNLKKRMKKVRLLVIDDIAVRDSTEPFKNEMYEIIDHRATEEVTTIYTSNVPLNDLEKMLGARISSRIDGMCFQIGFVGSDNRKGGLF